jgi:hypothetical protein
MRRPRKHRIGSHGCELLMRSRSRNNGAHGCELLMGPSRQRDRPGRERETHKRDSAWTCARSKRVPRDQLRHNPIDHIMALPPRFQPPYTTLSVIWSPSGVRTDGFHIPNGQISCGARTHEIWCPVSSADFSIFQQEDSLSPPVR